MRLLHGFSLETIYSEADLKNLGVTFEEFQKEPMKALERVGQYDAVDIMRAGYKPLRARQVQLRIENEKMWARDGNAAMRRGRTTTRTQAVEVHRRADGEVVLAA